MINVSVNGILHCWEKPIIMGIVNVTPDSFFVSVDKDQDKLTDLINRHISEGAAIIDIGGCSTRPDVPYASETEELERIDNALHIIRNRFPDILLSIDTFRSNAAKLAVEKYGVGIINDISGGQLDEDMFRTVGNLNVPYILTHYAPIPSDNNGADLISEMIDYFQNRICDLHSCSVKDIILDIGIGFGKTVEQNHTILRHLDVFKCFGLPVMAGVSHKSMIYKTLGVAVSDMRCSVGSAVVEGICINKGAEIIRTHDVRQCADTIKLINCITR